MSADQLYPVKGHYGNDCPDCNRHNSLLASHDPDLAPGYMRHICRDCGSNFVFVRGEPPMYKRIPKKDGR